MPNMADTTAPFRALPEHELAELMARTVTKAYPKNAIVVNEGDNTDSLFIILSGRVKIFVADEQGREFVLGNAGPGDYFGEIALDGGPRSASVMTLDPCRFAVITRADLKSFIAAHPGIALEIMTNLSRRVRALTERVKSLALMDAYGRIARQLLELAEERDGALVIDRAPTQQEIADRVGASRQMVSRIFNDLVAGGYVARVGRKLIILRKPPRAW